MCAGVLMTLVIAACGQGEGGKGNPPPGEVVVEETPTATAVIELERDRLIALPDGETMVSMVLVPGGEFIMGASSAEQEAALDFGWSPDWYSRIKDLVESAGPAHAVHLDSYYIDKYEVTVAQYGAYLEAKGQSRAAFWDQPRFNDPVQPVVGLSWFDAKDFCEWAGKRLPTEAEWEKAARGPEGLAYPWGDSWDPARLHSAEGIAQRPLPSFAAWTRWREALTDGSVFRPMPVGSFPEGASPYGAMDMAGNAWEWVADWYGPNYYGESLDEDPTGPARGVDRVLRGGAFDVPMTVPYTWFREHFIPPEFRGSMVTGFRCAVSLY